MQRTINAQVIASSHSGIGAIISSEQCCARSQHVIASAFCPNHDGLGDQALLDRVMNSRLKPSRGGTKAGRLETVIDGREMSAFDPKRTLADHVLTLSSLERGDHYQASYHQDRAVSSREKVGLSAVGKSG